MRHTIIIAAGFLIMMACSNSQKTNPGSQETIEEQTSIGGERDDHGCLIAAGETWSKMKEECVQIFNIGIRLNPVEEPEDDDAIFSSFVLINEDETELELFLPGEDRTSVLLSASDDETFKNGAYEYNRRESTLYIDGELSYAADR